VVWHERRGSLGHSHARVRSNKRRQLSSERSFNNDSRLACVSSPRIAKGQEGRGSPNGHRKTSSRTVSLIVDDWDCEAIGWTFGFLGRKRRACPRRIGSALTAQHASSALQPQRSNETGWRRHRASTRLAKRPGKANPAHARILTLVCIHACAAIAETRAIPALRSPCLLAAAIDLRSRSSSYVQPESERLGSTLLRENLCRTTSPFSALRLGENAQRILDTLYECPSRQRSSFTPSNTSLPLCLDFVTP
jgi:hypothetical protein